MINLRENETDQKPLPEKLLHSLLFGAIKGIFYGNEAAEAAKLFANTYLALRVG